MVQTIPARNATLRTLIDDFGLRLVREKYFFGEWQGNLPGISDSDKQYLDRVIDGFVNLLEYQPLLEGVVRMSVADPLLFLAGFYLPPFYVRSEPSIEIMTEDEGVIIRGSLNALVLKERLWIMIVESKRATYSVEAGLAQILAYMLASPNTNQPCYGMITSGGSFMFVKLVQGNQGNPPQYAVSKLFGIREAEDLYTVFAILLKLGQLAAQE